MKKLVVLINVRAGKASSKAKKMISSLMSDSKIFESHSLEESEKFSMLIIKKGYPFVIIAGGDGSITTTINYLLKAQKLFKKYNFFPVIGTLPLGSGNSISQYLGLSGDLKSNIKLIYKMIEKEKIKYLEMIEGNKLFFPFAGFGYDSLLLMDYYWIKNISFIKIKGIIAYFLAAILRTIPREIFCKREMKVVIINKGNGFKIAGKKNEMQKIAVDKILFEGNCKMVSAGTIPFYGYRLKALPFASLLPGKFHLRIVTGKYYKILYNLRSLWSGTFFPDYIHDFLVEDVLVKVSPVMPFQISGENYGEIKEIEMKISSIKIPFLSPLSQ